MLPPRTEPPLSHMTGSGNRITENLARVQDQVAAAAKRSGRTSEQIKLVAVTKYVDASVARQLLDAGCRDLGESRPQDLWEKAEALDDLHVDWHLIGHLQRNKVRKTIPLVSLLHSGDSLRLLQAVNEVATALDRQVPVLLEVNISCDPSKHGFSRDELGPLLARIDELKHLEIRGLMCMAGIDTDAESARREFAELRELRNSLLQCCPDGISLAELSMGMSRDFEVAIEEGATMVRVGSALYAE